MDQPLRWSILVSLPVTEIIISKSFLGVSSKRPTTRALPVFRCSCKYAEAKSRRVVEACDGKS